MYLKKSLKESLLTETQESSSKEASGVCPGCGGPAVVETYWSSSPDRPGLRILKRQTFCGKRPRRFARNLVATCPIITEELATESTIEPTRPKLMLLNGEGAPPVTGETFCMSSKNDVKASLEPVESTTPSRGRLPAELRSQIFDMSAEGLSVEEIAQKIGRSVTAVRKVLAVEDSIQDPPSLSPQTVDLDSVIDFLAELPADATQEIIQLAQLQRERMQLRNSLEMRLKDLKKKV